MVDTGGAVARVSNNIHFSSRTDEWSTPQDLFDKLNAEFGFTLDPCATHENAKCPRYYTKEDDGLSKSWAGEIVFMNPPYGRQIGRWVRKAYEEWRDNGTTVVCLLPARTDTRWFHSYIYGKATEIRFLPGRLKFGNAKNSAPFPSMIVVYRNNTERVVPMLIKVKDKQGNIFSTDMTDKRCIYEIHFCTSYTQFLVQEEYVDENGKKKYKHKSIVVPAKKTWDLETALDFIAVNEEELGEIISCELN